MARYPLDETTDRDRAGQGPHGAWRASRDRRDVQQLRLWARIRAERTLDPRRDRTRGFAPEVMAAQLVVSLCCGGVSLADAERLQADQGVRCALGVTRFADQTQLRERLRQTVARGLKLCPAGTVRTGGKLEIFFDDTQLEVTGKAIEGAAQLRRPARARLAGAVRRPVSRRPDRHRRPHARERAPR